MPIDAKKIEDIRNSGAGCVSDPIATWKDVIEPLLDEVERLRGETVVARDPHLEPERWVEVTVHASDPEQRKRTAAWIREANDVLFALQRYVIAYEGCPYAWRVKPEDEPRLAAFLKPA